MYQLKLESPVTSIQQCEEVLVCGQLNGKLSWFDKQEKIFYAESSHKNAVTNVCTINNDEILSSSADTTLKSWTLEGKHIRTFKGHTSFVMCCSSAEDTAVSGGNDKHLLLWDTRAKDAVHSHKHTSQILAVQMSSEFVFSGDADGLISVYDLRNFNPVYSLKHDDSVFGLHLSDQSLVSSSLDNTIKLWNIDGSPQEARLVTTFEANLFNTTMNWIRPCISDGGNYVACGENSGNTNIYELISQELIFSLGGHTDTVSQVLLKNNILISCGLDGSVIVGDVNIMD
eukprot:NODE_16_length_41655_cov_0.272813.p14 type:complete len:286 gc:universal NODE_16_length_41655_cov_0.272813:12273-13130(+)